MTDLITKNATLHILSKPITESDYYKLLDTKNDSDSLLFTRDACYSLLAPYIDISSVIALEVDCEARGIKRSELKVLSYAQWVDLTLEYKNTLSW